jgi:hypothetical protein
VEVGGLLPRDVNPGDVVLPAGLMPPDYQYGGAGSVFFLRLPPRFIPEAYEDLEDSLPLVNNRA